MTAEKLHQLVLPPAAADKDSHPGGAPSAKMPGATANPAQSQSSAAAAATPAAASNSKNAAVSPVSGPPGAPATTTTVTSQSAKSAGQGVTVTNADLQQGLLLPLPPAPEVTLLGSHSCLLYTSPSPRDGLLSRMPSSA